MFNVDDVRDELQTEVFFRQTKKPYGRVRRERGDLLMQMSLFLKKKKRKKSNENRETNASKRRSKRTCKTSSRVCTTSTVIIVIDVTIFVFTLVRSSDRRSQVKAVSYAQTKNSNEKINDKK